MKTHPRWSQVGLAVLCCSVFWGCERIAFDPLHGRLQGEWTLNESPECEVPEGVPVLAKVQVRNVYRWRVKLPADAVPSVPGVSGVTWKVLRPLPATLAAGASAEAWWLMEGTVPPGSYEVAFSPGSAIPGSAAVMRILDEPVSAPLLLEQRALVARLSGTAADLAAELLRQPEEERLPSTRLVLADLLRECGKTEEAALQLERFAEEIYGAEGLPSWLQERMRANAKPEFDEP